jgi:hypothetical protein
MSRTNPGPDSSTDAMAPAKAPAGGFPATSSAAIRCRLEGGLLVVPPFRLRHLRQHYISPTEIQIDLAGVMPGFYRVFAVHNFHVEDRNPRLDECVAGVFLAARLDDSGWEEPERFPVECRALAVLMHIEVPPAGLPRAIEEG